MSRATYYRKPVEKVVNDAPVIDALNAIMPSMAAGALGCVSTDSGIKERLPKILKQPLIAPTAPNHIGSLDFVHEALFRGKAFQKLNVIDEPNRELLTIEIGFSLPATRVIRVLEQMEEVHGLPEAIRLDKGPELRATVFTEWCERKGIELKYIQPGKPQQNTFIERFNRTYRHEVINAYLFDDLEQAREISEAWIRSYNEKRPHRVLGKLPPISFRQ